MMTDSTSTSKEQEQAEGVKTPQQPPTHRYKIVAVTTFQVEYEKEDEQGYSFKRLGTFKIQDDCAAYALLLAQDAKNKNPDAVVYVNNQML